MGSEEDTEVIVVVEVMGAEEAASRHAANDWLVGVQRERKGKNDKYSAECIKVQVLQNYGLVADRSILSNSVSVSSSLTLPSFSSGSIVKPLFNLDLLPNAIGEPGVTEPARVEDPGDPSMPGVLRAGEKLGME